MENRKYIVLKPTTVSQNAGGIAILSEGVGKTNCYVSLFGVENINNEVLIDDLVSVRQFQMKHKVAEFEIEKLFTDFTDFVIGVFNENKKLVLMGSTLGVESQEQKERLLIALENKHALSHFGELARNVVLKNKTYKTFFEETVLLLFDLFSYGVPDETISGLVPNSKWVKVFSAKEVIGVGIVESGGAISAVGLAYPVMNRNQRKKEIDSCFTFFPLSDTSPNGFGYYIVLQSAKDGSVVSVRSKKS